METLLRAMIKCPLCEEKITALTALVREIDKEIRELYTCFDHYERLLMKPIIEILSRPEVRKIMEGN